MKTDNELLKENLESNHPELIRTGEEVQTRVFCGCGHKGKAVMEVREKNSNEWFAYCKCEM